MQTLQKEECNYLDVSRVIGIYFVIVGHFMFTYTYNFIPAILNAFHMPMFFMISGILHIPEKFSWKALKKLLFSLALPYVIYNMLAIFYLAIAHSSLSLIPNLFLNILIGEFPVTDASWFLIALFGVKLFSLFLENKKQIFFFSTICLIIVLMMNDFNLLQNLSNRFMIKTAIFVYPFFTFGFLCRSIFDIDINRYYKLGLAIFFAVINILAFSQFGILSVVALRYTHLLHYLIQPLSGSLSVIFFSQVVLTYVKCNFIKDISRGTMLIVGIHSFIMSKVLTDIFFGVKPLRYILIVGFLFLLSFYPFIKLTYRKLPILYGKWRP